jgi:hypothetical protein
VVVEKARSKDQAMAMNIHPGLLPHHVIVRPVQDDEPEGSFAIDALREAHTQCGWVLAVSATLEEAIAPGDLVVFVGWKQKNILIKPVIQTQENTLYSLHEDDIEAVLEDW